MSGGVDSSVAAALAAEKVCKNLPRSSLYSNKSRTMISLRFLCGTGIHEMNPEQTKDANGRRTGKMYNALVEYSTFRAKWYASCRAPLSVNLTLKSKIDLSREYWNRVFEPSLKLWEAGQTPNPDVWCNRYASYYLSPYEKKC